MQNEELATIIAIFFISIVASSSIEIDLPVKTLTRSQTTVFCAKTTDLKIDLTTSCT